MLSPQETQAQGKQETVWDLDPAHSSAEFAVRHMMISTVTGRFKALSGTIELQEADPARSKAEAEIDVSSVDTGVADRDNHLRSSDFFDAAQYPKMQFQSTSLELKGEDSARLAGELTIRGVTKPVVLDVVFLGEIRDPWGHRRRGFAAETTLSRKDWGITWNQVLGTGGLLVGDRIKVSLNLQAVERTQA